MLRQHDVALDCRRRFRRARPCHPPACSRGSGSGSTIACPCKPLPRQRISCALPPPTHRGHRPDTESSGGVLALPLVCNGDRVASRMISAPSESGSPVGCFALLFALRPLLFDLTVCIRGWIFRPTEQVRRNPVMGSISTAVISSFVCPCSSSAWMTSQTARLLSPPKLGAATVLDDVGDAHAAHEFARPGFFCLARFAPSSSATT